MKNKNCPFCGSDIVTFSSDLERVTCETCWTEGPYPNYDEWDLPQEEVAWIYWNTRGKKVIPPPIKDKLHLLAIELEGKSINQIKTILKSITKQEK